MNRIQIKAKQRRRAYRIKLKRLLGISGLETMKEFHPHLFQRGGIKKVNKSEVLT
ncbi:c-di-GMP-binding flagellar brake protein YcgR [Paenibacillus sp. SORGH_AS306]|nr:hypothetical protein [Paenibacillus sp. SORGH_AS_0306]MDQ1233322.1 c-di-GMP-binding flagellar brake protein YcgR [Paenibacillus sp. SORGH_AS_0306]